MSALQDQRTDDGARGYYSIGGSRLGAWSVLPLHAREAANGRPQSAFHGNAALDLLEQPQVAEGVELLRFLGEWTPPAVAEPVEKLVEEPVVEEVAAEPKRPTDTPTDDGDFRLATDGDLVTVGTLACLVTSMFSAGALAGLATAIF